MVKLRRTPGILEAQAELSTGALSWHSIPACAKGTRGSQLSSPFPCSGRAEGLGDGLRNEPQQMPLHFPTTPFPLGKTSPTSFHFFTAVEENRRKNPKLSQRSFLSPLRFCLALGIAEGAGAGCSVQFVFSSWTHLPGGFFSHFHRALHTEAESSAKRSCQGTLSRGADASGGRKEG